MQGCLVPWEELRGVGPCLLRHLEGAGVAMLDLEGTIAGSCRALQTGFPSFLALVPVTS